jgi:hypothetical protein
MATDTYTGPQGGDWFDPANWSTGLVPGHGDIADIFGDSTAAGNGPSGVDATQATVSGVMIDLSGTSTSGYYYSATGVHYAEAPNLAAAQLGTPASPVSIGVTSDSGTDSNAALLLGTLDGSMGVEANQALAIEAVFGQNVTINGAITVAAGARVSFSGYSYGGFTDANAVILNGIAHIDGGTAIFDTSQVTGTGSIEIGDGGAATFFDDGARGTTAVDVAVTFDSSGGTLDDSHSSETQLEGTVSGFGTGDTIAVYAYSPDHAITTSYADGVLMIRQFFDVVQQITFAGNYTLANFDVQFDAAALDITYNPCFAAGTLIATPHGDRSVETLAPGDELLLADGNTAPIVWVGNRRQHAGAVVRIKAGALDRKIPHRDLILSTDHALFLDGVLVPAGLLVEDRTILLEFRDCVTFHHIELAQHAILLADGAPAESYLDTGNRRQFGNCALSYDPMDGASHEPCAAVVFGGPRLEAIRQSLLVTA